jgi:hypothetical protein
MSNLDFTLDRTTSLLHLRPNGPLHAEDFEEVTKQVDPHIEATGALRGILIETPSFPGWESLKAFLAHMRFVRDHHQRIRKVAVVTDSRFGDMAHLVTHFVAAEVKHFQAADLEKAKAWILSSAEEHW